MAITGTGAQSDPFTFDPTGMTADEVWADFKGCLAKEGYQTEASYSYCSLPEDYILDFNDVHDTIDNVPININVIIGNGFTVKNLSSEWNIFRFGNRWTHKMYDVNILKAYGYSLFYSIDATSSFQSNYFYGCGISGVFTTPVAAFMAGNIGNRPNWYFLESPYSRKGCGVSIEVLNGAFICGGASSPYCRIDNSHITFKGKTFTYNTDSHAYISPNGSSEGSWSGMDYIQSKNSLIEGKFDYLYLVGGTNSSRIDVEMDSTDGKLYCANTSTGNIYNSDKATLTYAQPNAQLVGVTDAQLKDPEYLNSIGFDIGDNTGGTS